MVSFVSCTQPDIVWEKTLVVIVIMIEELAQNITWFFLFIIFQLILTNKLVILTSPLIFHYACDYDNKLDLLICSFERYV